ncbi:MAG: hypothetical protein ACOYOT_06955 [Bacteroidales bacterium]
MKYTLILFISFFSLSGFASNSLDSVALENDYVKVIRHSFVNFSGDNSIYSTRIIVALSDTKIDCNRLSKTLKRGEVAVYKSTEKYSVIDGDFFEVLIKANHPEVKSPEKWIEPLKNKTVYENDQLRIFEERLEPGDTRELHSHAQRVVVRLNEVQLTDPRFHPNGTPRGGIQVPNTVKFAEPMTHVVKNLSEIPLFNIIIEFKTQRI